MRDFHRPGRSPVWGMRGMAATSMPVATLTALDVLRDGGNALDAAVAATAVLAVVEPQSTGIGGDCFCLYAPAGSGRVIALNGSGRAGAGYTIDWFENQGIKELDPNGPHVVTVPGAIRAWEALVNGHGRKELGYLLQPAIRLAEDGHPVHQRTADDWRNSVGKLAKHETTKARFLPGGAAPQEGQVFRQPELAATLRGIARDGSKAFYEGPVARDVVSILHEKGGLLTEEDLAAHTVEFVEPIQRDFRGHRVFQCPPNGSGIVALMIAGILDQFPEPAGGGALSVGRMHRHVEAARLAFRDRNAFVADPAKFEVPVERLLSESYLRQLAGLIDPERAIRQLPPAGLAEALPRHADTVYLCVVDGEGNACSFINSLFESFGSGILAPKSGVMLQNRGFGFRLQRGHPNCIAPGKRPMHTIIPGQLWKDGRCVMPYGVMGGHFQPMGHTLFLSNLLDYGMDVQAALDAPRVFPSKGVGPVEIETSLPQATADGLSRLGHTVRTVSKPHGGGQAILIDWERGVLVGGSDPRKDGCALGF
ncbi:MAG: gamma-glutamyltransferase [Alphaproteobacteria bacterium]|nr:gamma-glutamyltransferase [Alphaproteobacteria bacterium]